MPLCKITPWVSCLCLCTGALAALGCGRGNGAPKVAVIPEMKPPIKIAYGSVFLDGGSTEVDLVDAEGSKLRIVQPVHLLESKQKPKFIEGEIYIGHIQEVTDGLGTHCPVPSAEATKVASYLEQAIHEVDPKYVARQRGRSPVMIPGKLDLSCAKWMLEYIRSKESE